MPLEVAEFVKWCITEGSFNGCDIDGADAQDQAVKFGIIRQVEYDPEKHGPSDLAEPGDRWFVFTDEFKAALRGV